MRHILVLVLTSVALWGVSYAGGSSGGGDPLVGDAQALMISSSIGGLQPACPGGMSPECVSCDGLKCVEACVGDFTCKYGQDENGKVDECKAYSHICTTTGTNSSTTDGLVMW